MAPIRAKTASSIRQAARSRRPAPETDDPGAMSLQRQVDARTSQLRWLTVELALTEERERRTLARELHDNLGQLLAVAKIKLAAIDRDAVQSSIGAIEDLIQGSVVRATGR